MSAKQVESEGDWVYGASISPSELQFRYGLPAEEIASFQNSTYIYPLKGVIVREGENDRSIYLLRSGKVGIYKTVGKLQEQIATIEAVNFFGEMSLINEEPRSATVIALSENVVVYRIFKPNLSILLNNPKWSEILITRLSKNLAQSNKNFVAATAHNAELRAEVRRLKASLENQEGASELANRNTSLALNAMLYFQSFIQGKAVVESKGWAYLNALGKVSQALIAYYLPRIPISEKEADMEVIRACISSFQKEDKEKYFQDLNELL